MSGILQCTIIHLSIFSVKLNSNRFCLKFIDILLLFCILLDLFMEEFVLVTDYSHSRILQIGLHAGNVVQVPITKDRVTGLAFDKSKMTLFYSETSMNTITSTTLHGKSTELFYATGKSHVLIRKYTSFKKLNILSKL